LKNEAQWSPHFLMDMTKTWNGLENGFVSGLEGTFLEMLFLQLKLTKSLLKRTKHVKAALNKHLSMCLSHHSTL